MTVNLNSFRFLASMNKAFGRHRLHFIIAFLISFLLLLHLLSPSRKSELFSTPRLPEVYTKVPLPEVYTEAPLPEVHTEAPLPEVNTEAPSQPKSSPPTYTSLRQWEANLPQHDLTLPFPEGKSGRYVKFTNQIVMLGFNNVLNEV